MDEENAKKVDTVEGTNELLDLDTPPSVYSKNGNAAEAKAGVSVFVETVTL